MASKKITAEITVSEDKDLDELRKEMAMWELASDEALRNFEHIYLKRK